MCSTLQDVETNPVRSRINTHYRCLAELADCFRLTALANREENSVTENFRRIFCGRLVEIVYINIFIKSIGCNQHTIYTAILFVEIFDFIWLYISHSDDSLNKRKINILFNHCVPTRTI